ncbi:uncharacterized protein LOC100742456 [Bombus impatiens]|uniref:Uncharacterized protein LOC100742456 n=1 Tax=Bombus impatiens TaxID=132113 RepID=A0A6P3V7J0_BOMIM|nr:uncharacterized protein LOC100742456 [Bombus impatiens]
MQTSGINNKKFRITDSEYEKNVNLSIQWNLWLLKSIGLWPYSNSISRIRRYFYWFINITCYSLISFLFIPCVLYVFLEIEDTYGKLKQFGPLIFCAMAFAKYYSLIVHKADIRECLERIKWDWKNMTNREDREIMTVNASFGRKLVVVCTLFMYSGFVFYYIAIPISVGRVAAENESLTFIPLVFPFSRFMVDTRYSPTNEIVFSIQLVAGCLMHGITSAACSLAAAFAVHACGQMQVLMNWLKHLVDGRSDMSERVDGRIADIVCQHVRILKFLTLIENTIQQISFTEFLGCTLDICLVGYYVIMELKSNDVTSALTYMILLISITFNIFIFCYIGEIVTEECRKIGETSYMIEWYRLQGNKKLCCVLIIAMSNCTIKLTAGNIVNLTINTFADVVKTAVTFLNVQSRVIMSSIKVDQDYKKGVNLSIRSSRWILKLIGVWPNSRDASAVKKYFGVLLNAIYYALIMFLLLPGSLYVILEVEDVYNRIKLFGPLSFCVMALLKYYLLILHEEDIRECVERIEWDWKNITYPKDRELMMTNANFGRKLVIACTFFMYSGFIFFYIAVPMSVERIPIEGTNATFIPMVFPFSRFIIDTRYSPTNEIVFSIQFLAGALMHGITSAACSLAAIFAVHACGQMQVLMTWLNHLIDGRLDMHDCVDQRIAKIVSQHVRILKFLSLIERALQQVSYVEFLGCTLDICLLGYYIIMEWNSNHLTDVMTYSVLLVSLTFNIFIFCYIGELVADKSRKVGEMTYMIEWYRLYGKKKLCCVLIIAMSDSSRKLTAGNMVELSMSTFSDVVKTSVAFLNVLRTLT